MTIVAEPPAAPAATPPQRSSAPTARPQGRAFVRAHPGTGRARVHAAVVAAGERGGVSARFVLPVDRLATVEGRHLPTSAPFTVNLSSSELTRILARRAETAIMAAAEHLALTGSFTGTLRVPGRFDGGADLADAVENAALTALCEATETAPTAALRDAVAAATGTKSHPAAADGALGVHDTATGSCVDPFETFPRFYVVYAHVVDGPGGVSTAGLLEAGKLAAVPTGGVGNEKAVAKWLTAASAAPQSPSPLRPLLEAVHAEGTFETLGVVGGHTETDPVALLLPSAHTSLVLGQQIMVRLTRELASLTAEAAAAKRPLPMWRVTMSRVAAA